MIDLDASIDENSSEIEVMSEDTASPVTSPRESPFTLKKCRVEGVQRSEKELMVYLGESILPQNLKIHSHIGIQIPTVILIWPAWPKIFSVSKQLLFVANRFFLLLDAQLQNIELL
ncbi:hypothetical protein GEMRC1_009816 [Eukaryota sp. GEM-RC1]